jgi:magnesium-transporting ATPase (P-type)
VWGASYLGWKLESRDANSVTILANGARVVYDVLAVLEFNSDRKRMSLVLRDPQGTIRLVTKGADSVMLARAAKGQPKEEAIRQHLVRRGGAAGWGRRGWGGDVPPR